MSPTSITAGMHLPQAGPAASGDSITQVAQLAEELGFADIWVSDHLVIPSNAKYPPSAYIYEPLAVMAWVAAKPSKIRIGTTVLVLPLRNPIVVAKSLASIDQLSEGRIILGTAAGWLKEEFDALGVPFEERGKRTDEALEIIRCLWNEDNISASFPVHEAEFVQMRAKPQPVGNIPIWIGGHADVALRRACRVGDGWHGAFLSPQETSTAIKKIRSYRDEDAFTISMRTSWDPLEDNRETILSELEEYIRAGVSHFVPEPRQRTIDNYLRSVEKMASLLFEFGIEPSV